LRHRSTIRGIYLCVFLLLGAVSAWAQAAPQLQPGERYSNGKPPILDQVGIDQRINQTIPLDLTFMDENGQPVQLRQYFGQKPVIIAMVYYQCPMLCSQVLNGMSGVFNGIRRFDVGRDFTVLTVSFDPRDTPQNALEEKNKFLGRYRRPGAREGWHFLTGKQDQIQALTNALGFRYAWDPEIKQYAHASAIMLVTPDGHIAQYYYGIEYPPRDLQLGIVEASRGKVGNVVDQVLLYCYHYDPAKGKYGAVIFNILRVTAAATLLLLGGFIILMVRREHSGQQVKRA